MKYSFGFFVYKIKIYGVYCKKYFEITVMAYFEICDHAKQRLEERFPGMDAGWLYCRAQAATRAVKKKIRKKCSRKTNEMMKTSSTSGRYYLITPEKIVLVMKHPKVLVTLFLLED